MENLRIKYYKQFEEWPPMQLPMMANIEDNIYQDLLKLAIVRNKPLTEEEISKAYAGKVDLVEPKQDEVEDTMVKQLFNL